MIEEQVKMTGEVFMPFPSLPSLPQGRFPSVSWTPEPLLMLIEKMWKNGYTFESNDTKASGLFTKEKKIIV